MWNRWQWVFGLGCLLGVCWVSTAYAGPWSRAPGRFYVKLSEGFLFSKRGTSPKPGTISDDNYFGAMTSLYGEVGVGYGFQLHAFVPFLVATMTDSKDPSKTTQLAAFTDATIGVQWTAPFLEKKLGMPVAIRFNTKLPLFYNQDALREPLSEPQKAPILGEGQLDFTIWLSAGRGIPGTPLYAFVELGYRMRTEIFLDSFFASFAKFTDGLAFNGQLGWGFVPGGFLMLNLNGIIPFGQDKLSGPITKGFLNIGLGAYYKVWKGLALEADVSYSVWTTAVPPSLSFSVGVSYNY